MTSFETNAAAAAPTLGASTLRLMADRVAKGWPRQAIVEAVPANTASAAGLVLIARHDDGTDGAAAAAYLRGLAAGYETAAASVTVETVWTGPATAAVPVRATAQALLDVIDEARAELTLMTFSAREHDGIREGLVKAIQRGVQVDVTVETISGAKGLLSPPEPAAAFAGIPSVRLWWWNPARRPSSAHLHAKLAIADRKALLVSSANLTQSGVSHNIEAGLLVRGGPAPQRVAEHIAALRADGTLIPLNFAT